MSRIRYLKPEFFSDEDLAELPFETRLAYAGLWCFADREGRLEDRPKFLKAMIFPYDNIDMEKQLQILSKAKRVNGIPFIVRYNSKNLNLIAILSWHKHQKPHHTEKDSIFPPAPPHKDKDKDKDKDKAQQPLREEGNGLKTDKRRLKNIDEYKCPLFKAFWEIYPKKIGKGKAWEEWNKITVKKDENLVLTMKKVVIMFMKTEQWQKNKGQYIPNPATWLHQKRWDDEIETNKIDDEYQIMGGKYGNPD